MKNRNLGSALRFVPLVFAAAIVVAPVQAQDAGGLKLTFFVGPGIVATRGQANGEIQAGATYEVAPPDTWAGFAAEGGYLGPTSKPRAGSAFFSLDYMTSWAIGPSPTGRTSQGNSTWHDQGWKLLPFVSTGYTRLFGTGNAINFGGGLDYRPRPKGHNAIRFEIRDYYAPASPSQHNVAFRIGWISYIQD